MTMDNLNMQSCCIAAASFLALYVLSVAIYRRYFHPLSSFPGPFFASITNLHSCYSVLYRKQGPYFLQLHEKYGAQSTASPSYFLEVRSTAK
jgi:DNA phosphorothioation-dependent restriction protein DptG